MPGTIVVREQTNANPSVAIELETTIVSFAPRHEFLGGLFEHATKDFRCGWVVLQRTAATLDG